MKYQYYYPEKPVRVHLHYLYFTITSYMYSAYMYVLCKGCNGATKLVVRELNLFTILVVRELNLFTKLVVRELNLFRPQNSKSERKRKKISDSDRLFSRSSVTSHLVRNAYVYKCVIIRRFSRSYPWPSGCILHLWHDVCCRVVVQSHCAHIFSSIKRFIKSTSHLT